MTKCVIFHWLAKWLPPIDITELPGTTVFCFALLCLTFGWINLPVRGSKKFLSHDLKKHIHIVSITQKTNTDLQGESRKLCWPKHPWWPLCPKDTKDCSMSINIYPTYSPALCIQILWWWKKPMMGGKVTQNIKRQSQCYIPDSWKKTSQISRKCTRLWRQFYKVVESCLHFFLISLTFDKSWL